jgi:hypothetical protein
LVDGGFEGPFATLNYGSTCPAIFGQLSGAWFDNTCWPGNQSSLAIYSSASDQPVEGAAHGRVLLGPGQWQLAQGVALEPNLRYRAAISLRASAPVEVEFLLRQDGPPYNDYVGRRAQLGPTWQRVEFEGYTPKADGLLMLRAKRATGEPLVQVDFDGAELEARLGDLYQLPLADKTIDKGLFGMHFHSPNVPWPALGNVLSSVRIWDADGVQGFSDCAQWACIHKSSGVFDWTALDLHVQRAEAQGAEVIFNLGRPPQWASARPFEPSPYGPGQAAEPASLDIWRQWVTAVGQRYQGRIRHYEVWNEPNDGSFYTGTLETLVTLAREARQTLLAIDPGIQMISPCPYSLSYLQDYLEAGGGRYADIIGFHFYTAAETAPEFLLESFIPNARLILEATGNGDKPLWNTEAGWWNGPVQSTKDGIALLARTYLMNWAAGVERFCYYSFDAQPYAGLLLAQAPGYQLETPAGQAYRLLAGWLIGRKMVALERQGPLWLLTLQTSTGAKERILWRGSGQGTLSVPAEFGATQLLNLLGTTQPIGVGAVITLGELPVLLR